MRVQKQSKPASGQPSTTIRHLYAALTWPAHMLCLFIHRLMGIQSTYRWGDEMVTIKGGHPWYWIGYALPGLILATVLTFLIIIFG